MRALMTSSSMILLCMALIVGMTYALFTDKEIVKHHLQAGSLDITLERTRLTSTYLTNDGFLDTATDTEIKDFTNNDEENVFGLDGAVIVPGSEYTAEMKITNNSEGARSNVAFGYWIEIDCSAENTKALANQLEITVTTEDGAHEIILKDGLELGSAKNPVGVLDTAKNNTDTFTVSLKFLDDRDASLKIDNDDAQGQTVEFDLIVHAVQWFESPTDASSDASSESPTEAPTSALGEDPTEEASA